MVVMELKETGKPNSLRLFAKIPGHHPNAPLVRYLSIRLSVKRTRFGGVEN